MQQNLKQHEATGFGSRPCEDLRSTTQQRFARWCQNDELRLAVNIHLGYANNWVVFFFGCIGPYALGMYLVNNVPMQQNLHCFRACLRTPTRAAKYQVYSLRSFIRSSPGYITLIVKFKKKMMIICQIQQCLSVVCSHPGAGQWEGQSPLVGLQPVGCSQSTNGGPTLYFWYLLIFFGHFGL